MEKEMQNSRPDNKSNVFFALISALLIALSAFVGEILIPFASAFFGALLFAEGKNRRFSVICVILSVVMTAIFFGPASIWSAASVLLGTVIYLLHKFKFTKCDTSVLMTLIISVVFLLSFLLIAFIITGENSIGGALDFYSELFAEFKVQFSAQVTELYDAVPELEVDISELEEQISYLLDSFLRTLPSLIMIISFVLSGIALKLYTRLIKRWQPDDENVFEWKFVIPSIYAYFYIILYIFAIFMSDEGAASLVVVNISSILSFMFAYMGLKYLYRKMRERGRRVMAILLLVFGILFLGVFMIDLLSVFGVVYTIIESKNGGASANTFDNNKTNL